MRRQRVPAIGRIVAEAAAALELQRLAAAQRAEFEAEQQLEREELQRTRYDRDREGALAGTIYTAPAKPSGRPLTAQPIGAGYAVPQRGVVPIDFPRQEDRKRKHDHGGRRRGLLPPGADLQRLERDGFAEEVPCRAKPTQRCIRCREMKRPLERNRPDPARGPGVFLFSDRARTRGPRGARSVAQPGAARCGGPGLPPR